MIPPAVVVQVDGQVVQVAATATVLEAVVQAGRDIPTLCTTPWFPRHGTCRLCLVEVEGEKPVAACHTPVVANRRYVTHSAALTDYRSRTLRLLLAGHPPCDQCSGRGRCRLEPHARRFGLHHGSLPLPEAAPPPGVALDHPLLRFDPRLCIRCGLCRQACAHIQGEEVLAMTGRGGQFRLATRHPDSLEASGCVACGACLTVCPTTALAGREEGVEAPRQRVTTTCAYCAVGCQLTMETRDNRLLRVVPALEGSANHGHACVKGRFGQAFVTAPDRLTRPLLRDEHGTLRETTLDHALTVIARRYTALRQRAEPYAFAAISSARCTNEENFLLQKFTRQIMGSNSVDNCARVCHAPSAYALGAALGTGAGAYRLEDIEAAALIFLFGANPIEAHPVLGARIRQAVKGGCRLLVADPRRTQLATMADLHLAVRPGGNLALINALQWVVATEGLMDDAFVAHHGENLDPWRRALDGCTPEWAEPRCGVAAPLIRQAARLYGQSRAALILWGLGVTESCHGSPTAFGLVNLAIATGNLGRAGAGAGPLRGQNNVQGACDMGALPNVFSDYRPLADETARRQHLALWGALPPATAGYRIGDMWDAAIAGTLRTMHIMAQDVVQSDPDVSRVIQALDSLEFLVVQDLFLSETARQAHVVLPAASFLEKEGTFVNSDRRIQRVRQVVPPPEGVRSDGDLLQAIARRMGADLGCGGDDHTPLEPARVMTEIARLTPNWGGVTYAKLEQHGFIQWPCPTADHGGTPVLHAAGQFMRGRARLTPTPWHPPTDDTGDAFPLVLTTGRMLYHYNVGSMTRRTAIRHLHLAREERLRLHPQDARDFGITDGALVRVSSRHGQVTVRAEISPEPPRGVVFMTFHFAETRTNLLIGPQADSHTRCPEYKVTAVSIQPEPP